MALRKTNFMELIHRNLIHRDVLHDLHNALSQSEPFWSQWENIAIYISHDHRQLSQTINDNCPQQLFHGLQTNVSNQTRGLSHRHQAIASLWDFSTIQKQIFT
jgi:hypothetical protein